MFYVEAMVEGKHLAAVKKGVIAIAVWLAVPALFSLTVYSVWMDRAASAAVAGAFTLAFVILQQLPIIERFKIFTLEATFARRVDEAERLLGSIRETAEVHSRMLYWQLGKGDRMTSMPWVLKRKLTVEFDTLLQRLGLTDPEITALKAPLLHTIKLDLFRVFEHSVEHRLKLRRDQVHQQISAYPQPIMGGDEKWASLNEELRGLRLPFRTTRDVMDDGRLDDMASITAQLLGEAPLPASEKHRLETVRQEVIRLAAQCDEAGNITPEAENYLLRYLQDVNSRARELFEGN